MIKALKSKIRLLLLKLSFFLQTDMRYVATQGSWLASGQMLNNLISFFTAIAFANLLPKETFGSYRYILSIFGLFSLTTMPGMESAVIRTVAEGFENVYRKVITRRILWGLAGSLGALITAGYYFSKNNSLLGYACIIIAAAVPFFEPVGTYSHILTGKKRFDIRARYYSYTRLVSAVVIILTILATKSLILLLVAYFVPYIIMGFLLAGPALRRLNLNDKFDESVFHYGKHFNLISLISMGVNYLDGIIVFHFLGPIQLAIFSIAQAPVNRIQSLFGIIPDIALPKYAEKTVEQIKTDIFKKILKATIITGLIVLIYIVSAPFLFKLFLPKYADSVIFTQIVALTIVLYPFILITRIRTAKGSVRALYIYNIAESATQLIVMLVMISQFGLLGAVWGKVFVALVGTGIQFYFIKTL
ncbi:MAG: polysaccharide biosynthesis protein [Parcubacteria group bacterium Licking1014_17]|nr:MAG: polysaccharide biosynthesis protein [Parcubacteria group bacterium Licking1014_17]